MNCPHCGKPIEPVVAFARKLTGANADHVREMLADGASKAHVARVLGVHWTTVNRFCKAEKKAAKQLAMRG